MQDLFTSPPKPEEDAKSQGSEEPVWTYRGYRLKTGDFVNAMVHFFRAEIQHMTLKQVGVRMNRERFLPIGDALVFVCYHIHLVIAIIMILVNLIRGRRTA